MKPYHRILELRGIVQGRVLGEFGENLNTGSSVIGLGGFIRHMPMDLDAMEGIGGGMS